MASVEAVAAAATGSGPLRTVGNGGLPTVLLRSSSPREEGGDHAACATATIYLHGATLASWTVDGRELLFVSPGAAFAPPKAIRGGVPVCFPQFGMLGPLATQHGFARNLPWEVLDAGRADASSCTLELRSSEATLALWPHPFCLTMKVCRWVGVAAGSGQLEQQLKRGVCGWRKAERDVGQALVSDAPTTAPACCCPSLPPGVADCHGAAPVAARAQLWRGAAGVHRGSAHIPASLR